jgi:glucuronoarabinoxylan endo-1,4-beta-xylanase
MAHSSFKVVLSIVILSFGLLSCNKDDNDKLSGQLKFVESTVPTEDLSDEGAVFNIQVDWAYEKWVIVKGTIIEGTDFITQIFPSYGGDNSKSATVTNIKVTYKNNTNFGRNKMQLVLKSLTSDKRDTIEISQLGRVLKPINVTIDPLISYQTISGFGGANMIWGTDYLSSTEMNLAFGSGDESIGLSIYRVRLPSSKNDWAGLVNSIKMGNSHNAKVLASPWSPPAAWKSNNSINGGGHLYEANYTDFINYVNEYVDYMKNNGAVVDVVSLQNEPDILVNYEGCEYTTTQFFNLVKNHAGAITGAKVAAAESFNFKQSYTDLILNDATAVNNIDIVAGHIYGSGLNAYSLAEQKGKEIWMTEHLLNLDSGNKPENWTATTSASVIWDETMLMVSEIQTGMTYNWNAYIWWYIRRFYSFLGDGERGTTRGTILKRGHAMAQFAKFIRPGYIRTKGQSDNTSTKLNFTVYKGDNNKLVVVFINPESYAIETINVKSPHQVTSAVSYTTSINKNREKVVLTPNNNDITFGMAPKSVTTIVIN